jgi:pimeloyl-ACP methyl ester carboxylesterase
MLSTCLALLLLVGDTLRVNPALPMTSADARQELVQLRSLDRKPLDRPLVILGGYLDPGMGPRSYVDFFDDFFDGQIIPIAFADLTDIRDARRRVIETLDATLGPGDDTQTVEVDVIGQSMGGLVGMFSAIDDPETGRRLRVRTLFTIASPLRGAVAAEALVNPPNAMVAQMKPGSELLQHVAAAPVDYELVSYTRLDDRIVGEHNTAAPGRGVYWLDNPPDQPSHMAVFSDTRVLLDIVRRLRGEASITTGEPSDVPVQE